MALFIQTHIIICSNMVGSSSSVISSRNMFNHRIWREYKFRLVRLRYIYDSFWIDEKWLHFIDRVRWVPRSISDHGRVLPKTLEIWYTQFRCLAANIKIEASIEYFLKTHSISILPSLRTRRSHINNTSLHFMLVTYLIVKAWCVVCMSLWMLVV